MPELPELLIASDVPIAGRLTKLVPDLGLRAIVVDPSDLTAAARDRPVALVVVLLPGLAHQAELEQLKQLVLKLDVSVIALATNDVAGVANDALATGAELLHEPVSDEELLRVVRKCLALANTPPTLLPRHGVELERLFGSSPAMLRLKTLVERAAPSAATVLVRGESGTGKELVAQAIHDLSPRGAGPLVKLHCAALPETLLESELFGHERGAFTGALARKPGRVELAEGGSLFLDEIGDISLAMQVKLLRLLQEKKYERVGGTETLTANVRFIAATHRDLNAMVKSGEFREDLFYRLNVVSLWLPPLRARRDDIDELARRFARDSAEVNGKPGVALSDGALVALRGLRWPGNVRQLQNLVERLIVFAETSLVDKNDVHREYADEGMTFATQPATRGVVGTADSAAAKPPATSSGVGVPLSLQDEVRRAERRALTRALEHAQGNRSLAARVLGVSRATLYNKLAEHDLG